MFKWVRSILTKSDIILWTSSMTVIVLSYVISGSGGVLTLAASLIGVTSLIFSARGHFAGPMLMIVFSAMYGIISYSFRYYGEMMTYLGMTGPMAVLALISWLRNPFSGNRSEVRVKRLGMAEVCIMAILTLAVTVLFYFVLKKIGNANLIPSTLSVATSFAAVYLTERRSPYFAAAYAANDCVLILLWGLASVRDSGYIPVTVCFIVFLINDIYGFICWKKMERRQKMSG